MDIQTVKKQSKFPPLGLLIGGPKVGKSSFCATIPKALIVDLEGSGYEHIGAEAIVKPTNLSEFKEVLAFFFGKDNDQFEVLVIDHMREVTNFYADAISKENGVKNIDQIGYGKGSNELRHDVYSVMKKIRKQCSDNRKVILVAHSTDRNGQIRLDVDGKLDTLLTGMVDYIGHIYRGGAENSITFMAQSGSESGCRNEYLSQYNGEANWDKLQEVASGA